MKRPKKEQCGCGYGLMCPKHAAAWAEMKRRERARQSGRKR